MCIGTDVVDFTVNNISTETKPIKFNQNRIKTERKCTN